MMARAEAEALGAPRQQRQHQRRWRRSGGQDLGSCSELGAASPQVSMAHLQDGSQMCRLAGAQIAEQLKSRRRVRDVTMRPLAAFRRGPRGFPPPALVALGNSHHSVTHKTPVTYI